VLLPWLYQNKAMFMISKHSLLPALISAIIVTGCAATGEQYQANVYKAGQVNQVQEAKTVQILAVLPAKIEVDNTSQRQAAQAGGALLGALVGAGIGNAARHNTGTATAAGAAGGGLIGAGAGSLVADKKLVDGVSLTYVEGEKTLNSAQVGRACEFQPGTAIVISTSATETRIQPNATCPPEVSKK
jgi:outer membrane lipoprotein SlyB